MRSNLEEWEQNLIAACRKQRKAAEQKAMPLCATTREMDEWVKPMFDQVAGILQVKTKADYQWKQGLTSRCGIGNPSSIRFGRLWFERAYAYNDRLSALRIIFHELLHGAGVEHDYQLGFRSRNDLVSPMFAGWFINGCRGNPPEPVEKILAKTARIKRKRNKIARERRLPWWER